MQEDYYTLRAKADIEYSIWTKPEKSRIDFAYDTSSIASGIDDIISKVNDKITSNEIEGELKQIVRKIIGPIATPDLIQFSPALPKTRSGKIMRRILRKIAANEYKDLGDTSTLADPSVVESLVKNRKNI